MNYRITDMAKRVFPRAEEGACTEEPPDMFFPPLGEGEGSFDFSEEAKAICARCPVADECLEWAIGQDERYGIWGGMTTKERDALKRKRRRQQ